MNDFLSVCDPSAFSFVDFWFLANLRIWCASLTDLIGVGIRHCQPFGCILSANWSWVTVCSAIKHRKFLWEWSAWIWLGPWSIHLKRLTTSPYFDAGVTALSLGWKNSSEVVEFNWQDNTANPAVILPPSHPAESSSWQEGRLLEGRWRWPVSAFWQGIGWHLAGKWRRTLHSRQVRALAIRIRRLPQLVALRNSQFNLVVLGASS